MEFRILGPLEVADGDSIVALGGARQRSLLAILLLEANEVVSSDRLIDALWGEEAPESGRTALQVRVSQLRKALGAAGELIETRPPGYVLRLERGQLDLHRFEQLVAEATAVEPPEAAAKLREALALWRGQPLADLAYESFAQVAIARLEELRLAALEKRIEADLALGRESDVVAELETLVGQHPLRERFRAQQMIALYRCGRQADALAAYQDARRALVDDLGIEPTPVLRELEQAILRQDRSLELTASPSLERSVLVLPLEDATVPALLTIAVQLAARAGSELVLARLISDGVDVTAVSAALGKERERLLADGIAIRTAAFTSTSPGQDAVRLAVELDCDLLLIEAPAELLESPLLSQTLADAPCDVAVLVGGEPSPGPVLVPFVGAEHDWSAIELGAWLAGAWQAPLRLAGPSAEERDSSRLLASASLAVQAALGVAAEPLLLAPGPDGLLHASRDAALVISGLSDRWQKEGLGMARGALVTSSTPTLFVRRGLRPSGLAPRESLTRFTWSVKPRSA